MNIQENYPLLPHNTFGMDVKASAFIEYASIEELKEVLERYVYQADKWLHIGGGSNLLFTEDYQGVILHSAIKGYEVMNEKEDEVLVRVGAGEIWDDFVAYAVSHEWYGAENMSLIPGEVGASAVQNIGAYGAEAKDLIVTVETIEVATAQVRIFEQADCKYAYRESIFKKELKGKYIVTHVVYRLKRKPVFSLEYGNVKAELEKTGGEITLSRVRDVIIRIRESKLPDPKVQGNAGSFFMNPIVSRTLYVSLQSSYPDMPCYEIDTERVKIPAAWLIDRCGWKGKRLGNAGVHSRQALVLVNCGNATGKEIIALSQEIQKSVFDTFGVNIYPEVNFI